MEYSGKIIPIAGIFQGDSKEPVFLKKDLTVPE
jgi:hypothetical protein